MGRALLDLPDELLLYIARNSFVHEALSFTAACKRLRKLGLASTGLWHDVLERLPVPLEPGLSQRSASAEQLRAAASLAGAAHARWSRSSLVQVRRQLRLTSPMAGDAASVILLRIIRGARWAVTCTPSGRVVVWDLRAGAPAARHQLTCGPYTLEARTTMLDEDEDARGAVLGVHYALSGKRYLVVLRVDLRGAEARLHELAKKEISNAKILFALAVSGSGHRVAGARMDAQTHLVDILVWDYEANLDVRLRTDCVYLIHLSTLHMRTTPSMLVLYGTTDSNTLAVSSVTLPPSSLPTLRAQKQDKHQHSAFQQPFHVAGVPGYKAMPISLNGDVLSFFLRTPTGASFTHHRFSMSPPPSSSEEDPLVRPLVLTLTRASLSGDPRMAGSHAASPLLGAAGKRALWVADGRLYGCALDWAPAADALEEAARELALPPDVARVLPTAPEIAYDEAWGAVGVASNDGRIWVLWY